MKTKILFTIILLTFCLSGYSKIWTITAPGLFFSPETLTISLGDTVFFSIAAAHEVREVNQATWNINGITALDGGFSTPLGGGTILPAQLGLGTHYYVCVPHAANGMKAIIIVQAATGIEYQAFQKDFKVFPNPGVDHIWVKTITNESETAFSISDFNGKQILNGKLSDELTKIDITKFPSGIYMLLIGNSRNQSIKFIKE